MGKIKTVLGDISEESLGIALPHEHICCYSEYLYQMAGGKYLNKHKLEECAVNYLKDMKTKYNLSGIIDCTPVNIGRDISLLKRVSERSGIHIICSTGFYHTREPLLSALPEDVLGEYIAEDAKRVNAGIIKCAVEDDEITQCSKKLLKASAVAHKRLKLPIVMHTNARNKNGRWALEILTGEGVNPKFVCVSHLSDTQDEEYIMSFAKEGCYVALDRLYKDYSDEYISQKCETIAQLCEAGYEDRVLLSHDTMFFNGFNSGCKLEPTPRFNYCFDNILPRFPERYTKKFMADNVLNMLKSVQK